MAALQVHGADEDGNELASLCAATVLVFKNKKEEEQEEEELNKERESDID